MTRILLVSACVPYSQNYFRSEAVNKSDTKLIAGSNSRLDIFQRNFEL